MKTALFAVLLLFALAAWGESAGDLYSVRLPVEERDGQTLARSAAEGLESVLIRVSGQRDVADNREVQNALGDAQSYLRQYRYESPRDGEGRELLLEFTETRVTRLLREAGLPVWSSNRPSVLVWLVVDEGGERRLLAADSDSGLVEGLREAARERGIPLFFPLLDLEDNISIGPGQVWSLDIAAVRQASRRYGVQNLLLGRVSRLSGGDWMGSWAYVTDGPTQYLDIHEPSASEVAAAPIQRLADSLADRYAVLLDGDARQSVHIHVQDVGEFRDYARLTRYLEDIAIVEFANVAWVDDGGSVVMELALEGEAARMSQFFDADNRLVEVEPPHRDEGGSVPLPGEFGEDVGRHLEQVGQSRTGFPSTLIRGYYRWNG